MAPIRLLLLGSPLIERDGSPVKFDRRTATALLAFLALSRTPHRRDTLAALFWPEYGQAEASAYLRRTLWALNRALGADLLAADRETIGLRDDADLWVDALAFRQLLAACQSHPHQSAERCRECLARLAEAAELYRGDLLAGFSLRESPSFDEWQIAQAEALRQEYVGALEWLARGAAALDPLDQASAAARRWVAADPLAEPAHRLLIELYANAGRRSAALRQYHECARLLERELGVAPQPSTTALYERLRAADLADRTDESPTLLARRALRPQLTTVPAAPNPLIGRAAELAAARALLLRPEVRLLTLSGPGGTGKTRLAQQLAAELADEFADGSWFIALEALSDASLVAPTIAQALQLELPAGPPPASALAHALARRHMLLVLDNLEHLLAAADLLTDLLAAAPGLKLLATSRTRLRISGEHELQVPPLALPQPGEPADRAGDYAAVQLFAQRAQALEPGFQLTAENRPAVAEICRRLDGLPLAIELAAARIRIFSPAALLERLGEQPGEALSMLTGGPRDLPERQQTLRATLDWSYNLLAPAEQRLFARLVVFVGGCTLASAEAICGGDPSLALGDAETSATPQPPAAILDLLSALIDQSLLRREPGLGEPRFLMLATLREYALDRLAASGEQPAIRLRHAEHYLGLAEAAHAGLAGADQSTWLVRLAAELDNLRAALAWSLAEAAHARLGLRLAAALWRGWQLTSNAGEGRAWLEAALAQAADDPAPLGARAQALLAAAVLAAEQGDERAALPLFERSLSEWQRLGDQRGYASTLAQGAHVLAQGDRAEARELAEQSVALLRAAGDPIALATALYNLAEAANLEGDYATTRELTEEGLALFRAAGDRWGVASGLIQLGYLASALSDYARARALFEESRALWGAHEGAAGWIAALLPLGWVAWIQGAFDEVVAIFGEVRALAEARGDKKAADWALNRLGWAAWARGDLEQATALFEQNWATAIELGSRTRVAWAMSGLAHVALSQGDHMWAAELFSQSLATFRAAGYKVDINWALNNLARARAMQGDAAAARVLFAESLALSEAQADQWNIAAALEGLAALAAAGEPAEAAQLARRAAAIRAQIGAPIWLAFRAAHERAVAVMREALGERAFAQAWAEGADR